MVRETFGNNNESDNSFLTMNCLLEKIIGILFVMILMVLMLFLTNIKNQLTR